ncbi:hypothetical protein BU24DRAFT_408984 [Aaosphaeria arxii CBS 175.79]|uniref:Uncharacterized protein n=1 Tax=Aaosphaeria arxii CBS 175.79 TaxID=1450172 RepID=A0A6A5XSZ0_9PLEO|nr:uncharacterized protein BU24DRAFT_408984 [Aaosphaeria arxii CBS 175.79]KAF2015800.1 hypothetical protein BU24DRAFT_408984 [Aaosphaeria arxii CBS 175.79]
MRGIVRRFYGSKKKRIAGDGGRQTENWWDGEWWMVCARVEGRGAFAFECRALRQVWRVYGVRRRGGGRKKDVAMTRRWTRRVEERRGDVVAAGNREIVRTDETEQMGWEERRREATDRNSITPTSQPMKMQVETKVWVCGRVNGCYVKEEGRY